MDSEKQRNYWLFLGEFTPQKQPKKDLWDIDPSEKEADEEIYHNAIDNYVNTSQEKLNISEGRLRKLTLLELNSVPTRTFEFEKYFDTEFEFDRPTILTPSIEVDSKARDRYTSLRVVERPADSRVPSIFGVLDQMADFFKAEEDIWSDLQFVAKK